MLALKWPIGSNPELDIPPVPRADVDLDLEIPPAPPRPSATIARIRDGAVVEPNRPDEIIAEAPPAPVANDIDDFGIPDPAVLARSGSPSAATPTAPAVEEIESTRVIRPSPEEDLRSRAKRAPENVTPEKPTPEPERPAWEFPMSYDKPEKEYEVPISYDKPEVEYEVPISYDRPDKEYEIPISYDRVEEDPAFLSIPTPPSSSGISSGSTGSTARAAPGTVAPGHEIAPVRPPDEIADGAASKADRTEIIAGSIAASSGDPATSNPATPKQPSWRDPDYVPDWGSTEERKDPEYFITPSEDRAEREYDIPISQDRVEKDYYGPLSRSRDERSDDDIPVPTSQDRIEKDYYGPLSRDRDMSRDDDIVVPISQDKPEKEYYFPTSEDRKERDIVVPVSRDRVEKDYYAAATPATPPAADNSAIPDFGAPNLDDLDLGPNDAGADDIYNYGGISDTLAAMEFGSEIAASLAQLVQEASADEASGTDELRLRLTAWYDGHGEALTTYIIDPCIREPDGTESAYHSVLSAGPSPERCLALDCQMLEKLKGELGPMRQRGTRFMLGLPVAASTLLRPKFRSQYLQLWQDIEDEVRQTIRLTAYNLPETSASQASDLFGWMRSLGRAPIVRIPPRVELVAPLGGFGVYAVAINYQKWFIQLGPHLFVETLLRLIKQCRQHRLRLALTKLPDRRAVQIGLAAGVDYLEIGTVDSTVDIPRLPIKLPKANALQRFGTSFAETE